MLEPKWLSGFCDESYIGRIVLDVKPGKSDRGKSHDNRRGRPGQHRSKQRKKRKSNLAVTAKGKTRHLNATIMKGNYIAFDIETTGGNPERNGITEIFALRYKEGKVVDTFCSMVNPKVPIPPIVRRMTGITNKMVRDAPLIEDVMPGFVEFIEDDVLVSHNTIGDMKFIRYFSKQVLGSMVSNYYLCTHLLVEKLVSEAPDKSLKGLADFFHLPADAQLHRAKADAFLTLELFKKLQEKLLDKGIDRIIDAIRFQGDYESGTRLGWGVNPETLKKLPETTGIFYLYDYAGKVTFLSSAHNIAREVRKLQRFGALPKQLLKSVLASTDVRYAETPTAFSAALAEAEGLKEHAFRFDPANWHQRTANFLFVRKEDEFYRVGTGPLGHDVHFALGPIRGGKEVSILMENLSEIFGEKVSKRGMKLSIKEGELLLDFLKGKSLKGGLVDRLRSLLPIKASSLGEIRKSLHAIAVPMELNKLEACSGLIAVPRGDAWHIHSVASGIPFEETVLHGDLIQGLTQSKLNIKFYKKIKKMQLKRRLESEPLPYGEAMLVNRMFWWAYFGERHQNVRVFQVEDLANLSS